MLIKKMFFFLFIINNLIIIQPQLPETKINDVIYQGDNFGNQNITFLINYEVQNSILCEDEIKFNVIFQNSGLVIEYEFEETLTFKGSGKVYAKTPLNKDIEKKYIVTLSFESLSNVAAKKIVRKLIIRRQDEISCLLDYSSSTCNSNNSNYYVSSNKEETAYMQQIKLENSKKYYLHTDNKIDLNKIVFEYKNIYNSKVDLAYEIEETYGVMYLKDKIEGTDILFIEGKGHLIPIKLKVLSKNKYSFELAENFYLDLNSGVMYKNYKPQLVLVKNVFLPYLIKEANFCIEFEEFALTQSKLLISFEIKIMNDLIGKCYNSNYCLRNNWQ